MRQRHFKFLRNVLLYWVNPAYSRPRAECQAPGGRLIATSEHGVVAPTVIHNRDEMFIEIVSFYDAEKDRP